MAWSEHVGVLDPIHVGVDSPLLGLGQDNVVLKECTVFNDTAGTVITVLAVGELIHESVVGVNSDGFPPVHPSWGPEADLDSSVSTAVACVSMSLDSDKIMVL